MLKFILIFCISLTDNSTVIAEKYNVIIYGKTDPATRVIRLYQMDNNFNRPYAYTLAIDSISETGNYKLRLYVEKPIVAILIWDKVIIHPNDSIEINFTYSQNNKYALNIANGDNGIFYNFFHNQLGDWEYWNSKSGCYKIDFMKYFKGNNNDYEGYEEKIAEEAKKAKENFKQQANKKELKDTAIVFNELQGDVLAYLLMPLYNPKIKLPIPNQYVSKIKKLMNDKNIQKCISYSYNVPVFLDKIILKPENDYQNSNYLEKRFNAASAFFKNNQKVKDGYYLYLFNRMLEYPDSLNKITNFYFQKYINGIQTKAYLAEAKRLENYFKVKMNKSFSGNIAKQLVFNIDGATFQLAKLFEAEKAEYYYLDIWATWCSPCITVIKNFEKVRCSYDSLKIKRINISVDENKTSWESMNSQLLQKEDYSVLAIDPKEFRNLLNILTIPRYILLDNSGNILSIDAPAPGEIDKIIRIINPKIRN